MARRRGGPSDGTEDAEKNAFWVSLPEHSMRFLADRLNVPWPIPKHKKAYSLTTQKIWIRHSGGRKYQWECWTAYSNNAYTLLRGLAEAMGVLASDSKRDPDKKISMEEYSNTLSALESARCEIVTARDETENIRKEVLTFFPSNLAGSPSIKKHEMAPLLRAVPFFLLRDFSWRIGVPWSSSESRELLARALQSRLIELCSFDDKLRLESELVAARAGLAKVKEEIKQLKGQNSHVRANRRK